MSCDEIFFGGCKVTSRLDFGVDRDHVTSGIGLQLPRCSFALLSVFLFCYFFYFQFLFLTGLFSGVGIFRTFLIKEHLGNAGTNCGSGS